jgi:hypothetical protein
MGILMEVLGEFPMEYSPSIPWRTLKEVFREFLLAFLRHFVKNSLGMDSLGNS